MNGELLVRAARCYRAGGWLADAGRCFDSADQPLEAAWAHEQAGAWAAAAKAYERAEEWSRAAACHRRGGAAELAVRCLLEAGDTLEAAWLLADELGQFGRARRTVATQGEERDDEDEARPALTELRREAVLARCEAADVTTAAAGADRLRDAMRQLDSQHPGNELMEVSSWLLAGAEALGRPDLSALIHAAVTRAGAPGAVERWERWALETLGDASGIPTAGTESQGGEPDGRD